jgi:hypothetical protein
MAHIVPVADQAANSVFLPLPAGRTEVRWPLYRNLVRELQSVAQWLGFAGPKRTRKGDLVRWIAERLQLEAGGPAAAAVPADPADDEPLAVEAEWQELPHVEVEGILIRADAAGTFREIAARLLQ